MAHGLEAIECMITRQQDLAFGNGGRVYWVRFNHGVIIGDVSTEAIPLSSVYSRGSHQLFYSPLTLIQHR